MSVPEERERTPHVRYEVGGSCCGAAGYFQLRADAFDECERLQHRGHLDVRVFDRMARKGARSWRA